MKEELAAILLILGFITFFFACFGVWPMWTLFVWIGLSVVYAVKA